MVTRIKRVAPTIGRVAKRKPVGKIAMIQVQPTVSVTLGRLKRQVEKVTESGSRKQSQTAVQYVDVIDQLMASRRSREISKAVLVEIKALKHLNSARRAALTKDWDVVLKTSYALLSALPGKPTWDPDKLPKPVVTEPGPAKRKVAPRKRG